MFARSRASTSKRMNWTANCIFTPDECIDCGACEPECPVSAIFEQSAVPSEWNEFPDLDRRWCTGDQSEKNAVRARSDEIQPPVA